MKLKKDNGTQEVQNPAAEDEALFEALKKSKKKKRRKRIRIVVILLMIAAAAGFAGTRYLQREVRTQLTSGRTNILSAAAERGTISTLVSGSGMLVNVDTEVVSIPSGVTVTEILVKYGDSVTQGQILATVDMASVRSAMSDLQEKIESLDKEISGAKADTVDAMIFAKVSGRVKAVYAQKGDLVEDVMVEHGGLALLSLDGHMQAEVETSLLSRGESVTVVLPDGTEVPGTVDSVVGSKAAVLLTDNGPMPGETVTILTESGAQAGKAELAVHNPMVITGYAGTVSNIGIAVNQMVYAYSNLFTLKDTGTTVNYDAFLRTRSEYEETLRNLLSLQRSNAVVSPISGSVYSAADLDAAGSEEILDIVTLSPDKQMQVSINVDESDILSLKVDQKADITVSSLGDTVLSGVVTEIDRTYSSGYYTALVTLDKVPGMIPGMTANVDIRIEGVDDAILIPTDALHQTSTGYFVYTSYDEETGEYGGQTDVVPGLSNSKSVEIKSGLREGDTVYYTVKAAFPFSFGGGSSRTNRTGSGTAGWTGTGSRPTGTGSSRGGSTGGGMPSGNFGSMPGGMPSGFGG